jgi:hypothetical protein
MTRRRIVRHHAAPHHAHHAAPHHARKAKGASASGGGSDGGGGDDAGPGEPEPSDDGEADAVDGDDFGGLVRTSPLPVGRYWVDIPASKQADFDGYLSGNQRITVETTEGGDEGGTFYIFRVLQAVPWFAVNFGFPNTAGPEIKSRADTTQAPDLPLDGTDAIDAALHKAGGFAELAMGLAVVVGVVVLGSKLIDSRSKGARK